MRPSARSLIAPLALLIAACAPQTQAPTLGAAVLGESVSLEGRAIAPGSGDAAGNGIVYLADPADRFETVNGRLVAVATDASGRFRIQNGVPAKTPVVVVALLPGNRRLVGLTTPAVGPNKLDLTAATTAATELLRERAALAKRPVTAYDLDALPAIVKRTADAIAAGTLAEPALEVAELDAMTMAYAGAVGRNVGGLGEPWARLLGARPLAAERFAGSGDAGAAGGAALAASFYHPAGLARDRAGTVYVADAGNHLIRRVDGTTGAVTTIAGTGKPGFTGDGGPAAAARLNDPRGLVLDRAETALWVFDTGNLRVRRIDLASGRIATVAGAPLPDGEGGWQAAYEDLSPTPGPAIEARLAGPVAGAFDGQGNLFIADGHTIRKLTPGGDLVRAAGLAEAAGTFAGENVPALEARLNGPTQLLVTPDEQLYVADTGNHVVRKIDLTTRLIATMAGVPGRRAEPPEADGRAATETALDAPTGIAVDARGRLFVAERGAGTVRMVDAKGRLVTVAGGGDRADDGESRRVRLRAPAALAVEGTGDVLVLDGEPGRIWRVWTRFQP